MYGMPVVKERNRARFIFLSHMHTVQKNKILMQVYVQYLPKIQKYGTPQIEPQPPSASASISSYTLPVSSSPEYLEGFVRCRLWQPPSLTLGCSQAHFSYIRAFSAFFGNLYFLHILRVFLQIKNIQLIAGYFRLDPEQGSYYGATHNSHIICICNQLHGFVCQQIFCSDVDSCSNVKLSRDGASPSLKLNQYKV